MRSSWRLRRGRLGVAVALLPFWFGATWTSWAQELPGFELRNWDGQEVSTHSLRGATTVVAFTYAKCILACPMITFQLVDMDRELGSPVHVRYLHVSVNPAEDTAEEILLHFAKHEIDPRVDPRWMFANGPEAALSDMLAHLGIEVERTPVEGGYLIEHTILVLIVGPDGRTLESFDTYNWNRREFVDAINSSTGIG